MGVQHSTPIPSYEDFDHDPNNEITSNSVSISNDLPSCNGKGQFYGIQFQNDDSDEKHNTLKLSTIPGATSPKFGDGDRTASPYSPDGWHVSGHMDALGGRLKLFDRHRHLVAAVEHTLRGYLILGRVPMYQDQQPYHNMYIWAKVYRSNRLGLQFIIQREDTKDKYVADACGEVFGPRMIRILNPNGKACAFARQHFPEGAVTDSRWDLLVGPGVCPSLMICFVSLFNRTMGSGEIVSKFVGKTMTQSKDRVLMRASS